MRALKASEMDSPVAQKGILHARRRERLRRLPKDFQTHANACTEEYAVCRPGGIKKWRIIEMVIKIESGTKYAVSFDGRRWMRCRDAVRRVLHRNGMVGSYMYIW